VVVCFKHKTADAVRVCGWVSGFCFFFFGGVFFFFFLFSDFRGCMVISKESSREDYMDSMWVSTTCLAHYDAIVVYIHCYPKKRKTLPV